MWLPHRDKPFSEATIWKLLECMIDGLTLLETGKEYDVNGTDVIKRMPERLADWKQIVHFDLKPQNCRSCSPKGNTSSTDMKAVLLSDAQEGHEFAPIVKLADFGTAKTFTEDQLPVEDHQQRLMGTPGYYTPEQFTKWWDYKDWAQSEIAGQYSTRTNVWQIGAVLYNLITCQAGAVVEIHRGFKPQNSIFGNPSKGLTYGHDLYTYIHGKDDDHFTIKYSETLIHTCWEMLYEIPAHRPSLFALKQRIVEVCKYFEPDDYEVSDQHLCFIISTLLTVTLTAYREFQSS